MSQWITLGIVLTLLLGIIGWLVYKEVRTKYPEGKLYKMKWNDYRVNLIVHPEADLMGKLKPLKVACLNAVKALVAAHNELTLQGQDVSGSVDPTETYFKEYTVHLIPEDMMIPNAAAYLKRIDGIPTGVVSDKYVLTILEKGEPVIAEGCHIVLNDYVGSKDDHEDKTIWARIGGENSLQFVARKIYKVLSTTLTQEQ